MNQLHTVGARLGAVGRCALVGMLVGMLATQAVAEGADGCDPENVGEARDDKCPERIPGTDQPCDNSESSAGTSQDNACRCERAARCAGCAGGTSDSASLTMPPELKAMMDDASKNSQNLQPAPASKPHGFNSREC
jgi:hypothetical protein